MYWPTQAIALKGHLAERQRGVGVNLIHTLGFGGTSQGNKPVFQAWIQG